MATEKKKKTTKKKAAAPAKKKTSSAAPKKKKTAKPKTAKAAVAKKATKKTAKPAAKKKTATKAKPKKAEAVKTVEAPKPAPAKKNVKAAAPVVKAAPAPAPKVQAPAPSPAPKVQAPAPPPAPPVQERRAPAPPPVEKAPPPPAPKENLKINETVTVKDLAEKMKVKVPDVIKALMGLGKLATINQRLDFETAALAADGFGFEAEMLPLYAEEALNVVDDESQLLSRPPVVTVMGHVDHGKTSLLDAIRETRVADKEAGGITQHIGAYQIKTDKGLVTFLDTPGHEAFTSMRARGAQATDLVVLVVAADDGVMPQTIEALDHARAANVPIIVAINKCDLPQANVQKVKQELANHNLLAEDWGGKTVMVEVSAKTQLNLDKLLEMLALESELLELKANPNRSAQGVVVEAKLDPKRGQVATVLIQKGTLRVGDSFVCGQTSGRIRALVDHSGHRVKEAKPAFPVEILGLSGTPETGDKLNVVSSEREAREIVGRRKTIAATESQSKRHHLTLEAFHHEMATGKVKSLPIILKADVQGSLEAVRDALEGLGTDEISIKVIHYGVGGVNSSDVILADASDAVIIGFNVRPDPASIDLARRDGVEIKTYRVIYELVNEVKAALEGLLEPEENEVTIGWAEIREVFKVPKVGNAAGCYVTEGKISRTAKARLLRNGTIVFEGALSSLKRFKDDVREVDRGYECGVSLVGYSDIKSGDRLEFYVMEKKARRL